MLISRSHILIQLMETGRKTPAMGLMLPWKHKLRETGAGGDLHTTSSLSHPAQEPICPPCWSLMFWSMATKSKLWMWGDRGRDQWHFRAEAFGIEDMQLRAFMNLVFESRAGVSHCPFANVLIAAASEHARSRKDLCRGILHSPWGVPSVLEGL